MQMQFFCPRWGSESLSWKLFCDKVKSDGYDGIEYGIDRTITPRELDAAWNAAEQKGLKMIAQHYDTYEAEFECHFDLYNEWLQKIRSYPVAKINSQTGKDFFSFDQNKRLIEAASASGLNVVHETHRNKFAFAAHVTLQYLDKIPGLKLALDVSHWVCVSESYLEDQPAAVEAALLRTEHLHARVGYPEGPQVPDPRSDLWQTALNRHLAWWDLLYDRKKKEGEQLTITPEFGPFPYMVHLPWNGQPVADQREINLFMMDLLKNRYQ